MLIHDIDTNPLLLIAVDLEFVGKLLQLLIFVIRNRLVFVVKVLEDIMILLVLFIDQLDQVKGAAMAKHGVDFIDQLGIVAEANMGGTLEGFTKQTGDILLLLLQFPRD